MYNIIFLDFDGVLNSKYTKEKWKGWAGIEDEKLQLLKDIVDNTKSIIVLTSSWRHSWDFASYLLENTAVQAARRLSNVPASKITKTMLQKITLEDVKKAIDKMKTSAIIQKGRKDNKPIGFRW